MTDRQTTPAFRIGLPTDPEVLALLRDFAVSEWGLNEGSIDGATLDLVWSYFYEKAAAATGVADRAAELAKNWRREMYGAPASPMLDIVPTGMEVETQHMGKVSPTGRKRRTARK